MFDGVLGTRTRGGRMVGADESTELWRQRLWIVFVIRSYLIRLTCWVLKIDALYPDLNVNQFFNYLQDLKCDQFQPMVY